MEKTIFEVKQLNASYGQEVILKNLDFSIKEGEVIGIIGESGIGKSTFLECLLGNIHQKVMMNANEMKFLEEMSIVAEAVSKAFNAEKMNYELLGNGDTHLHWHLFPRVNGDLGKYGNNGKGPVWWYPMQKMYDDSNCPTNEELRIMKSRLLMELDKLL